MYVAWDDGSYCLKCWATTQSAAGLSPKTQLAFLPTMSMDSRKGNQGDAYFQPSLQDASFLWHSIANESLSMWLCGTNVHNRVLKLWLTLCSVSFCLLEVIATNKNKSNSPLPWMKLGFSLGLNIIGNIWYDASSQLKKIHINNSDVSMQKCYTYQHKGL